MKEHDRQHTEDWWKTLAEPENGFTWAYLQGIFDVVLIFTLLLKKGKGKNDLIFKEIY